MLALVSLSGCASVNVDQVLEKTNQASSKFTNGQVVLVRSNEERQILDNKVQELLSKNLSQNDAVQLTLLNSPTVQALIAQNWSDSAFAAQSGRMVNPVFTFERIMTGPETEFNRWFVFGLLN